MSRKGKTYFNYLRDPSNSPNIPRITQYDRNRRVDEDINLEGIVHNEEPQVPLVSFYRFN